VPECVLVRTPELTFRFLTYWRVIAARRSQKPDIRMPFHHLSSQGFWVPQTSEGQLSKSRNTTARVVLDASFHDALDDPVYRLAARQLIISRFFEKPEQAGLFLAAGLPVPPEATMAELEQRAATATAVKRGREARFRLLVVAAYNYTCALTGYRLITMNAGSLVDAAHIHQFSDSRNNHPTNGLALSKNAHWLFDNGLWTIREDFTVQVAVAHFFESHPLGLGLLSHRDQKIILPENKELWPAQEHLAWHRSHKFVRSS
jgi:putative restriction endonuclease